MNNWFVGLLICELISVHDNRRKKIIIETRWYKYGFPSNFAADIDYFPSVEKKAKIRFVHLSLNVVVDNIYFNESCNNCTIYFAKKEIVDKQVKRFNEYFSNRNSEILCTSRWVDVRWICIFLTLFLCVNTRICRLSH